MRHKRQFTGKDRQLQRNLAISVLNVTQDEDVRKKLLGAAYCATCRKLTGDGDCPDCVTRATTEGICKPIVTDEKP